MQEDIPELEDDDGFDRPSKSQLKRDMTALQKLGEELLALPESRWAPLALPEILVDALKAAKKITNFEGRRRQIQYVGKLMRKEDTAAIQAAFDEFEQEKLRRDHAFHRLERWRDRLIEEGDEAVAAFLASPGAAYVTGTVIPVDGGLTASLGIPRS